MRSAAVYLMLSLGLAGLAPAFPAGGDGVDSVDLVNLTLEELLDIEVTSVSRKPERISEATAAVFVITSEDIRRSGYRCIPDVLRMVPGLEVARIDAGNWAISCRGFNGLFSNKLLVLIDGRSVYTPLFSGVFWDVTNVLLEDIERIEVIRGPGASMWGANAVNGVINIIMKHSDKTTGNLGAIGTGTKEALGADFRHGGSLAAGLHYRAYGMYFDREGFTSGSDGEVVDEWAANRGGFRIDWRASPADEVTLHGNAYSVDLVEVYGSVFSPDPPYSQSIESQVNVLGGDLLGRWQHVFAGGSEAALQVCLDSERRETDLIDSRIKSYSVDFQHNLRAGGRHEIIWGLGCRYAEDATGGLFGLEFIPADRQTDVQSSFLQDEIVVLPERLHLTLGSKFEYNDYTGLEVQPTARVLWTPHRKHTLWGAVSRAVRTPSRSDRNAEVIVAVIPPGAAYPESPLVFVSLTGNEEFDSEDLTAYEVGYRVWPVDRLSLDIAAFLNIYADLGVLEYGSPEERNDPVAHLIVPISFVNGGEAETHGFEIAADYRPVGRWRLRATYSWLEMDMRLPGGSGTEAGFAAEGEDPAHQATLCSWLDLPGEVSLDLAVRYVHALPAVDVAGYTSIDARIGWRPLSGLEVSLAGANLLDNKHLEFESDAGSVRDVGYVGDEMGRSVYGMLTVGH